MDRASLHDRCSMTVDFAEIAAPRGPLGGFALSPDGMTIAYVGARVDGPDAHDLYLQPVAGGPPQNVTAATIDRPVASRAGSTTSRSRVTSRADSEAQIAIVGRRGRPAVIAGIDVNPSAFARSPDGHGRLCRRDGDTGAGALGEVAERTRTRRSRPSTSTGRRSRSSRRSSSSTRAPTASKSKRRS